MISIMEFKQLTSTIKLAATQGVHEVIHVLIELDQYDQEDPRVAECLNLAHDYYDQGTHQCL